MNKKETNLFLAIIWLIVAIGNLLLIGYSNNIHWYDLVLGAAVLGLSIAYFVKYNKLKNTNE